MVFDLIGVSYRLEEGLSTDFLLLLDIVYTSFLIESTLRVLAWVANIRDENDSSRWIENFDMQTQRIILALPYRDSDRYLVILESL